MSTEHLKGRRKVLFINIKQGDHISNKLARNIMHTQLFLVLVLESQKGPLWVSLASFCLFKWVFSESVLWEKKKNDGMIIKSMTVVFRWDSVDMNGNSDSPRPRHVQPTVCPRIFPELLNLPGAWVSVQNVPDHPQPPQGHSWDRFKYWRQHYILIQLQPRETRVHGQDQIKPQKPYPCRC